MIAHIAHVGTNKTQIVGLQAEDFLYFYSLSRAGASHSYARASTLCRFNCLNSTHGAGGRTGQKRGDKECPFSA